MGVTSCFHFDEDEVQSKLGREDHKYIWTRVWNWKEQLVMCEMRMVFLMITIGNIIEILKEEKKKKDEFKKKDKI